MTSFEKNEFESFILTDFDQVAMREVTNFPLDFTQITTWTGEKKRVLSLMKPTKWEELDIKNPPFRQFFNWSNAEEYRIKENGYDFYGFPRMKNIAPKK